MLAPGTGSEIAADLRTYLQQSRDTVLSGLDGLTEYDARRPLTPTGTNVLGVIKHLVGIETGYLGECVGRSAPFAVPWIDDGSIWDNADMWATAEQSRAYLVGLYRQAWAHADATLQRLSLDSPAHVPWWPDEQRRTTLGHLTVRVVAETAQHAGQIDIMREQIDGATGSNREPLGDAAYWTEYVDRVHAAAQAFSG